MLGQESRHSNLVYRLLQGFVSDGLVKQKTAPGSAGKRARSTGSLLLAGTTLIEQTSQCSEQDTESECAFHMRVGLFKLLSAAVRTRVLAAPRAALERHDQHMAGR